MNKTNQVSTDHIGSLSHAEQLYQQGNYQAASERCTQALLNSGLSIRRAH